jgi:hypothetical protein
LYLIFQYHRESSSFFRSTVVAGLCAFFVSFIFQTIGLENFTMVDNDYSLKQLHIRLLSRGLKVSGEFTNFLFIFTIAFICALTSCCLFASCQEQAVRFSHIDQEFEQILSEDASDSFRRFLLRLDLICPLVLAVFYYRRLHEDLAGFFTSDKPFILHSLLIFVYLFLHLWSIRQYCQDFLHTGIEVVQAALAENDTEKIRALPRILRYLIENVFFVVHKYFILLSLLGCVCLMRIRILSISGSFPRVEETSFLFHVVPLACFQSVAEFLLLWLLASQFLITYGSLVWNKLRSILYK